MLVATATIQASLCIQPVVDVCPCPVLLPLPVGLTACAGANDGAKIKQQLNGRPIDSSRMELSRTFKWFSFAGGTGDERWKNAGSDFHHDLEALSKVLHSLQLPHTHDKSYAVVAAGATRHELNSHHEHTTLAS